MMSSIERYIIFEALKPLSFVLIILVALFACFSSARYLAEAVAETLGIYFMLKLILLKTLIALEVLVPIALYISIVMALGRLHRDQEIVALRAGGGSDKLIIRAVLLIAVPISLAVGALSMQGRPWAYQISYILDARAKADLDLARFQPGRFYGNEDTGAVVYFNDKTGADDQAVKLFHYARVGDNSEIIVAATANQREDGAFDRLRVHLNQGRLYRLNRREADDVLIDFQELVKFQEDPEIGIEHQRKSAPTASLLASDNPPDIAEVQWRLSRPVTTMLLALIAIPLSRSSPRQGKNEQAFMAALVFAVYYNLSGVARAWVEQGLVAKLPGVWWLHLLMAAGALVLLAPGFKRKALG